MNSNKREIKRFSFLKASIYILILIFSFNYMMIPSAAIERQNFRKFIKTKKTIPQIILDEATKNAYNKSIIKGKIILDSGNNWVPDNQKTFLSYHVFTDSGELIAWDGKRFPIEKNASGQYFSEYDISVKEYVDGNDESNIRIEFDIVVEGAYWYSELQHFKTSRLDVNCIMPVIKQHWVLFPKIYISGSLTYIPSSFSIGTEKPESFKFRPSIRTAKNNEIYESRRKDIKITNKNQKLFSMIPFDVPNKSGIYKAKLGFIYDGVMWYPEQNQKNFTIIVLNPILVFLLWIAIIFGIKSCQKYIIMFLNKLQKYKQNNNYRYIVLLTSMFFCIVLFSFMLAPTIFSRIGILILGVLIPLILIIFFKIDNKVYMPFVVFCQLVSMEISIAMQINDYWYANVQWYGIIISCIIIFLLVTSLSLFFRWKLIGSMLSIIVLVTGSIYYLSQIYYFKFFKDFLSIKSLGYSGQLLDTFDSIKELSGGFEKILVVTIIMNLILMILSATQNKIRTKHKLHFLLIKSKILIIFGIIPMILFSLYTNEVENNKINITVNGKSLDNVYGVWNENVAYVPVEKIYKNMGMKVDWDKKRKLFKAEKGYSMFKIDFNTKKFIFNDKQIKCDEFAYIKQGSVFVPIDIISKTFGLLITQNENNNLNIDSSYLWINENLLIAHAFGGIEGQTYTNSLEALLLNYKKGHRIFEGDLIFTSDDVLVGKHDWDKNDKNIMKYEQFKNKKIYGKYTPVEFDDIAHFLKNNRDVWLVTDTKATLQEEFGQTFQYIVQISKKVDEQILDRIIPQIYNEKNLETLKSIYDFKSIIYTLYQTNASDDEVIKFAEKNGIKVITMSTNRYSKEFVDKLAKKGIVGYIHTINNLKDSNNYRKEGIHGFYTDFILPKELEKTQD